MKNHKALRWEANQRRRLNAYLPKLNKVLFALDKILPDVSDRIMSYSEEIIVSKPSAAEREACVKAFRTCGFKAVENGVKTVNEYGIKYSRTFDFGYYRKEDYDGVSSDHPLLFTLTFKYDLAEDCKITYKEEQIETKNCVVGDDGTIFKVVQVVDKVDCGDVLPTLESLGGTGVKKDMNVHGMDADLIRGFKIVCISKGLPMKTVIVRMMKGYIKQYQVRA